MSNVSGSLPQASHNKLGKFWYISSWQSWCKWVRFVGPLARTHFFSAAHKCSIGLRSGLCDGHFNTLNLLSLNYFATTLEVCLGSLSIWKTHLRPSFNFLTDILLQYIHTIVLPHNAIYFVKCSSPSCNKAPPQHDAVTPCFTVGMVFFGLQASPIILKT